MPHASEWEAVRDRPRFLQPLEFSLNPCAHCPGHCCSGVVALTTVEALRLCLTLSLPLDHVVVRSPVQEGAQGTPQTLPTALSDGVFTLQLRHKGVQCVFLHHVEGRGMCAAHAVRPAICRLYPYDVDDGGRHVRVGGQNLCPVRWLHDDAADARVERDVRQMDADMAQEKKLLSAWKRRKSGNNSWAAYIVFSVNKLAHALGFDAAEILRPPRRRLGGPR